MSLPQRHSRAALVTTGLAGLATLVLWSGAQGLIQVGGGEPPFDAPAAVVQDYFTARDPRLYAIGSYLMVLGVTTFVWFLGGVHSILREVEDGPPWRSTVALASGLAAMAAAVSGSWDPAVFRMDEGVDPQLSRFAFDAANLGFATSWMLLGSFAIATGWLVLSSRTLPDWLGWPAIVAGLGLLAARAAWETPFWFFPYALFWIWIVALSIYILRWSVGGKAGAQRCPASGSEAVASSSLCR